MNTNDRYILCTSAVVISAVVALAIMLAVPLLLTDVLNLDNHRLTEDLMYRNNPFRDMCNNWSSEMYSVEYENIGDGYTIPVTYDLVNMLANDYPCADEQFVVLSKENVPIAINIFSTSRVAMRVDVTGEVTPGSYVLHSHPLQVCGDFSEIGVATFPSPRDLISESSEGIDDIIVVTKISNSTARASRVTGFSGSPDTIEKYDTFGTFFGYEENVVNKMFDDAGIRYRFFTIIAYENTIVVIGD